MPHSSWLGGVSWKKDNQPWLGGTMYLCQDQSDFELLVTELHEAMHAAYPDLCERAVDTGSTDIAKFLWRLGYRKSE